MSLLPNEVKSENIATVAVTTPKIADEAVTASKLDERSVTEDKLATGAVTTNKLADNAVTNSKIRDGTIKSEKIAPQAITTAKIGEGQVTGSRIQDRAITSEKLANNAVTTSKIADGSVTKAKLSFTPPSVTRLITPAITSAEIGAGAVGSSQLAAGSVTEDKIATDAVTQSKIARNSVGWSEIKAQSLEPEQIKTLSGAPATEGQVPVADLSEGNQWWFRWAEAATRPLTPALTSAELGVGSVESEKIQDGAVTQEKLAPGVGGDRFVWGAEGQSGNPRASADVLYLTDISSDIPYTVLDLSAWVPAGAKAVLIQIGIFNQAFSSGRAFFRVRTNVDQRDALGVGLVPGGNSQVANQGMVPITASRGIEYALESVGGPWSATLTLYITLVGYIV